MYAKHNSLAHEGRLWLRLRDNLINAIPELADDDDCLIDTVDGETSLNEAVGRMARSIMSDQAMDSGLAETIKNLQDKKIALQTRAERKRTALHNLCDDLGRTKIEGLGLTCTVRKNPPSLGHADINKLPHRFIRTKREPDKIAILAELKTGVCVPGAELSNQSTRLQIK